MDKRVFGVDIGGTTVKMGMFTSEGELLDKWEIPYDEIIYGKPWPGYHGFYVDDRTVRPSEFLTMSVEELDETVRRDRCK